MKKTIISAILGLIGLIFISYVYQNYNPLIPANEVLQEQKELQDSLLESFLPTAYADFIEPMNPPIIECDNLTCQSETAERIIKKTLNNPAYSRSTSNGLHNYTRRSTPKFWWHTFRTSRFFENYNSYLKLRRNK